MPWRSFHKSIYNSTSFFNSCVIPLGWPLYEYTIIYITFSINKDLRSFSDWPPFLEIGTFSSCHFFFFLTWSILKVFIEFVTILLPFYILFFWSRGMWNFSSLARDQTHTSYTGRQILTTGLTGKSPGVILYAFQSLCISFWSVIIYTLALFLPDCEFLESRDYTFCVSSPVPGTWRGQ